MPTIRDRQIVDRWTSFYGEESVGRIQHWNQKGVADLIRVNTLKTTPEELVESLGRKGTMLTKTSLPEAWVVGSTKYTIGSTHEYLRGDYAIQGLASQFVGHVLDPRPRQTVLDLAAAPGGKTSHISALMGNTGVVVAVDTSKKRLTALRSNLARLGVENTVAWHGSGEHLGPRFGSRTFDRVLLDAPCTGSGSICRTPNKPWLRTLEDVERMVGRQKALLRSAVGVLRPGGLLVYSTCSLEPEEGEYQIRDLLEHHSHQVSLEQVGPLPEWRAETLGKVRGVVPEEVREKCLRILPDGTSEGFFVARLRRHD